MVNEEGLRITEYSLEFISHIIIRVLQVTKKGIHINCIDADTLQKEVLKITTR
jgi:hypothetical protein